MFINLKNIKINMSKYLTLGLEYNIKTDKFKVSGDVNEGGQREIVETFLRYQIGAGVDDSEPNRQEVYNFLIKWYSIDDRITIKDDTGNKGLRDGILIGFLRTLPES